MRIDYYVKNISEYITIIKELSDNTEQSLYHRMLFRGESKNYYNKSPEFISSAFRSNRKPIDGYETLQKLPFKENVESFKYEIYSEINADIKKNFLAYSQHHGIKTNLIDITLNPLISLYFSAESKFEEEGYVYIINSPVLDITEIFKVTDEVSILDIITSDDKETVSKLMKKFYGFGSENMEFIEEYFYLLFQDYYRLLYDDDDFIVHKNENEDLIIDVIDKIATNDSCKYIMDVFDGYREGEQKGFYYFILLRGFCNLKKHRISHRANGLNGIVPMIYKPAMSFKRGINQSGLFLYQNYVTSKGNALITTQLIAPDYTIKIKNKKNILKELDMLNINRKFIYGDHSSVAQYIEEQHDEKRLKMMKISENYFKGI